MKYLAVALGVLVWIIFASLRGGKAPSQPDDTWLKDLVAVSSAQGVKTAPAESLATDSAARTPVASGDKKPVAKSRGYNLVCRKTGTPPRSLVMSTPGKGCRLLYKTPEGTQKVAWSDWSTWPCQEVRGKISLNLRKAGYRCR